MDELSEAIQERLERGGSVLSALSMHGAEVASTLEALLSTPRTPFNSARTFAAYTGAIERAREAMLQADRELTAEADDDKQYRDARDAATAFILAMDKAAAGERYLIGACNITLDDFFKRLSHLSGVRAPWLPVPEDAMVMGSKLWGRAMRAVGLTPSLDAASVDMARHFWYIDSSRAIEELGWTPRAANATLKDTITWLRAHFPELDRSDSSHRASPPADAVSSDVVEYARSLRER